ncbi:hypothetical protein CRYUN_Cryun08bG0112800 [Craigia yunnanensis]
MDLKHFSHEHPLGLVYIQEWSRASEEQEQKAEESRCFACEDRVEGPSCCCSGCEYLHNTCTELELAPQINHPFHPPHPIILLPRSPYSIIIQEIGAKKNTFGAKKNTFGAKLEEAKQRR